jgi:SAM-dependent methyltransferase
MGHYRSIVANVMRSGVTTSASVLDVGCATGGLIQAFIEAGFSNVEGISLSQAEVDACIAKGFKARCCGVEAWLPNKYDIVTVSHVLEHVPDVQGFLQNLKRWVNLHGSVYIEVPNAIKYVNYFSSICQGFNAEHINHFDLKHLVRACVGMEVYDKSSYESMTEGKREYPVIWVLAHPHASDLKESVVAYATLLERQMATMKAHLHDELKGVDVLAIWGMGQTTRLLVPANIIPAGVQILWATDSNPVYHWKNFEDAVVYPPEKFTPPKHVPILVCSQLSKDAVIARIKELGLTNRIITLEK